MIRRFVNLVSENYKSGLYSLHRLDVSNYLFYASRAEAQAAVPSASIEMAVEPAIFALPQLPAPCTTTFHPSKQLFALMSPRSSDSRILCRDMMGPSIVYDADANSLLTLPSSVEGLKGRSRPVAISAARPRAPEEDLYIIHPSHPGQQQGASFEVLRFGPKWYSPSTEDGFKGWYWESLPSPPLGRGRAVTSHAVVDGGRTICVSVDDRGTYCFDIVERTWSRTGNWLLPFKGGAEFVPELDLWIGFAPGIPHRQLCATAGLSSAMDRPPTSEPVMPLLDDETGEWKPVRSNLISLGQARFCVVKVYWVGNSSSGVFAVLTGVELVNDGDENEPQQGQSIRLVAHKSLRYDFIQGSIQWEL